MIFAQLDFLNESELVFPTLEVFHILGFAVATGTIAILDFRLLGWALVRQRPADLAREPGLYTMLGRVWRSWPRDPVTVTRFTGSNPV